MGVDPQMLVAQDGFAEPGGLSSAQTVVISWINSFPILLTGNRLDLEAQMFLIYWAGYS